MADTVETAVYRLRVEGQDQIDRMTKSIEGLAVAEEDATKATRTTSDELQKRMARYDPLIRAQQAYSKELQNIARYQETGVGTQQQINALFEGATARYQAAKKAIEGLDEAHKGLNAQGQAAFHSIRSVVEQVALGIPITQALTGQINHLSFAASGEGGLTGAFKQAGSMIGGMIESAKNFLTPGNLTIGVIVGMGAAIVTAAAKFASAQKEIERSLIGIGGQSGATAAKINAFAQIGPQQSITGMSIGEKREAGTTFAQAGVDVSKLKGVEDAIRGYAIVAGTDATKATEALAKALGGDLVRAVEELEKVYGALDPTLRDTVQAMLLMNDKAGAQQAIMDAVAAANKRALDTITPLSAIWSGLINVAQMVGEGWLKILSYRVFEAPAQQAAAAAKQAEAAAAAALQQANQIQNKGQAVVDTYEPEIQQVKKLQQALADLVLAKNAAAAAGKTFDDGGAEQKIRNMIAATNEAQAAGEAWQQTIARVSAEWQGVSQSAALALHALELQLPVIEAIGGAAKMVAQYALDYQTTLEKTGNETEALRVASMNRTIEQAKINASAEETLWNLKNQLAVAQALTEEDKRSAEFTATKNKLLHDGVDAMLAQQVAAAELTNKEATAAVAKKKADDADLDREQAAFKQKREQQEAIWNRNDRIARSWGEYETKMAKTIDQSAIAASKMSGMAISGESLAHAFASASMEAERLAAATDAAAENTARAAKTAADFARASRSLFEPVTMPTGALTFVADPNYPISYRGGGTGKRLSIDDEAFTRSLMGPVPESPVKDLTNSINQLKTSTDSLNATNQDLLSPYYTQDPRTTHIGFRSQGMALGGYVEVPGGYSSNDNMVATIPVASGERIYVDPMGDKRGVNGGHTTNINISSPITINGNANKDEFGRTLYQNNQTLAKQVRAAAQ